MASPASDEYPALYQSSVSRIYWFDAEQTALIHEVIRRWNWDEAFESINALNQIIRSHPRNVYTIHFFRPGISMLPRGLAVTNLHRLLREDPENEKKVIFVGATGILQSLINMAIGVYKLTGLTSKYHFVKSLDDALRLIQSHRKEQHTL